MDRNSEAGKSYWIMKRQCPECKKKEGIQLTHPEGFWEKNVFPLLLLRPHRCQMCWNRFYLFSLPNGVNGVKRAEKRVKTAQEEQFEQFFKPPDEKEFQELIAQIREAESKIFGRIADGTDATNRDRLFGS